LSTIAALIAVQIAATGTLETVFDLGSTSDRTTGNDQHCGTTTTASDMSLFRPGHDFRPGFDFDGDL
jgi:hypothetical protein